MEQILLTNYGVVYDVGEVTDKEARDMVSSLEKKGVILELAVEDKGYISQVMFLRKLGERRSQKGNEFSFIELLL